MVLGIKWLRESGSILWNFEQLTMKFKYKNKKVEMKGLAAAKWIEEGSLNKCNWMEKKGVILQVMEGDTWVEP